MTDISVPHILSTKTGICNYTYGKGKNKGVVCGSVTRNGNEFCSRHVKNGVKQNISVKEPQNTQVVSNNYEEPQNTQILNTQIPNTQIPNTQIIPKPASNNLINTSSHPLSGKLIIDPKPPPKPTIKIQLVEQKIFEGHVHEPSGLFIVSNKSVSFPSAVGRVKSVTDPYIMSLTENDREEVESLGFHIKYPLKGFVRTRIKDQNTSQEISDLIHDAETWLKRGFMRHKIFHGYFHPDTGLYVELTRFYSIKKEKYIYATGNDALICKGRIKSDIDVKIMPLRYNDRDIQDVCSLNVKGGYMSSHFDLNSNIPQDLYYLVKEQDEWLSQPNGYRAIVSKYEEMEMIKDLGQDFDFEYSTSDNEDLTIDPRLVRKKSTKYERRRQREKIRQEKLKQDSESEPEPPPPPKKRKARTSKKAENKKTDSMIDKMIESKPTTSHKSDDGEEIDYEAERKKEQAEYDYYRDFQIRYGLMKPRESDHGECFSDGE